jgi:hypothetical protein
VLVGDQPVGVLTLGVRCVGRHHLPSEVQPLQQRLEPGDLVGGGLDVGLAQDHAAGVVLGREQVNLRLAVVAAAAEGLAVDRDRPTPRRLGWGWVLVGQPAADDQVQRVRVDAGQHAAHGRLGGWPPDPAQRVAAHPECGQDRPRRISSPLADRGQGSGAGQHRGDRHGQHHAQRMLSAAPLARVGDLGEILEQVTALGKRQCDGRVLLLGGGGNAR